MDVDKFWNNVKQVIDEQHTTQEWLANHCGISFRTFQNWIYRHRLPDAIETYRIAQALGVSVEYLVTGQDPARPDLSGAIQKTQDLLEELKKL